MRAIRYLRIANTRGDIRVTGPRLFGKYAKGRENMRGVKKNYMVLSLISMWEGGSCALHKPSMLFVLIVRAY